MKLKASDNCKVILVKFKYENELLLFNDVES